MQMPGQNYVCNAVKEHVAVQQHTRPEGELIFDTPTLQATLFTQSKKMTVIQPVSTHADASCSGARQHMEAG